MNGQRPSILLSKSPVLGICRNDDFYTQVLLPRGKLQCPDLIPQTFGSTYGYWPNLIKIRNFNI
jgi:hypothetical protein